jgi:WD40 repeat protein
LCHNINAMLGTTLSGRYKIVQHLGGGGFGQTYLAEDLQLPGNPLCVVKQLKPRSTDPLILQTAKRLFDREAQVLYKLGNHDQIPRLLAHFEQEQEFYLVQEFIEGHDLKHELSLGKRLTETQVIALCQELLNILEFVHQQDVIHRDIKPANIIRRKHDGKLVLIDFGAVKEVTTQSVNPSGQTSLTVAIGSPGYMPNEQLSGKPQLCSDIYAVGRLGIQALTGLPPSQLPEDPKTSEIRWRDKWQHNPPGEQVQTSVKLADVLDKMVRYDYRQRYQTAREALQAFQQLAIAYSSSTTNSASQITFTESADPFESTVTYPRPPQVASSQQDRIDEVESTQAPPSLQPTRDLSEGQVSNKTRKPLVSKSWNKSSTLIAIGVGIATALALTVGIYHVQTSNVWNKSEQISLANTLTGHSQRVSSIAITPDGQLIASGSEDKTIKLWNLRTGQLLRTLTGHSEGIRSIAISLDGKLLASGGDDKTIKLWNLDTGKLLRTLTGHSEIVQSVTISPDGKLLASGSNDKTVKLWNLETGQEIRTLTGFSSIVYSVAISPDGQSLVSGAEKLYLWHLPTGNLMSTISDPSGNAIPSLAMTPDSETLVSGSNWGKFSLWNLRNLVKGCKGVQPCRPTHILSGSKGGWVHSLAISPDGKTLATGSDRENTIKLWNALTGKLRISISNRSTPVESLAFSPDGNTLVTNGEDGKIEIWRSP